MRLRSCTSIMAAALISSLLLVPTADYCCARADSSNALQRKGDVTVKEQTPVNLAVENDLKSGTAKVGDVIEYDLVDDLYNTDHQLIAPMGAKAYGKVLTSKGAGMFAKSGKLEISADFLVAPDGTHIPLRGDKIGGSGPNQVVGMVAVTVLVSVLGVFINGRNVELHPGQVIPMYVNKDTAVAPCEQPNRSQTSRTFTCKKGDPAHGTLEYRDDLFYFVGTPLGTTQLICKDQVTDIAPPL